MISCDQTGAFPHTSARGNRYVMMMEDSDAGRIKSRKKEHLITGFITMYNTLKKAGINPLIHHIDNKFSQDLIEEIETQELKYQVAPPGYHCTLPAEKAIKTFKITSNPFCMGVTLDTPKINGTN